MAIQIAVKEADTPFGLELEAAYVRITQVVIDWSQRVMQFSAAVWADSEAREANKQPVMQLPTIQIKNDATPEQWRQVVNDSGVPVLGEDGRPQLVQTAPALPSFATVEQQIGQAIVAGQDYRTVGYNLLKSLDVVKNNTPVDV